MCTTLEAQNVAGGDGIARRALSGDAEGLGGLGLLTQASGKFRAAGRTDMA